MHSAGCASRNPSWNRCQNPKATRVSYLGEWSPLFRWFASMCGVASAGMVAMALLGSATPDAVIIVTLAAALTGLALGAIGYLMGGAK